MPTTLEQSIDSVTIYFYSFSMLHIIFMYHLSKDVGIGLLELSKHLFFHLKLPKKSNDKKTFQTLHFYVGFFLKIMFIS